MDRDKKKRDLREYYEKSAVERGDMDGYQYLHRAPGLLLEKIAEFAKDLRGRILDIGCGDGRISLTLANRDRLMIGVELARRRVERAREKFSEDKQHGCFCQGDAEDLPLQDGVIDGIVLTEVLEHVLDDRKVLRELTRVLKPGGWVILSIPSISWRKYILIKKNKIAVYDSTEHLREYSYFDLSSFDSRYITFSDLEKSFPRFGLKIIKRQGVAYDLFKLLYFIPLLERLDFILYSRTLNKLCSVIPFINRLPVYRIYLLEKKKDVEDH
jgi:2-polyprenyl-3-methyl-5-hydroxy-6-metoxy-1,4-benzoquinol methylase